jgi:hypothetical protein
VKSALSVAEKKRPMGLSGGRSRPQGNHHIDSIGMKIAIIGLAYVGLPLSLQLLAHV